MIGIVEYYSSDGSSSWDKYTKKLKGFKPLFRHNVCPIIGNNCELLVMVKLSHVNTFIITLNSLNNSETSDNLTNLHSPI